MGQSRLLNGNQEGGVYYSAREAAAAVDGRDYDCV